MIGDERVGELVFPKEWFGDLTWLPPFPEIVATQTMGESAEQMIMAGGCLEDGTNVFGICWPGGQNISRTGPATRWGIEERIDENAPAEAKQAWAILIRCSVDARREIEDAIGGRLR